MFSRYLLPEFSVAMTQLLLTTFSVLFSVSSKQFWIGLKRDNEPLSCNGSTTGRNICQINSTCPISETSQSCQCRRRFRWIDGSPMTFHGWAASEPQGSAGNECGWMTVGDGDDTHRWGDGSCTEMKQYVCKKGVKSSK